MLFFLSRAASAGKPGTSTVGNKNADEPFIYLFWNCIVINQSHRITGEILPALPGLFNQSVCPANFPQSCGQGDVTAISCMSPYTGTWWSKPNLTEGRHVGSNANEASLNGCLQPMVKFSRGCKQLLGCNSGVVLCTTIGSAEQISAPGWTSNWPLPEGIHLLISVLCFLKWGTGGIGSICPLTALSL